MTSAIFRGVRGRVLDTRHILKMQKKGFRGWQEIWQGNLRETEGRAGSVARIMYENETKGKWFHLRWRRGFLQRKLTLNYAKGLECLSKDLNACASQGECHSIENTSIRPHFVVVARNEEEKVKVADRLHLQLSIA